MLLDERRSSLFSAIKWNKKKKTDDLLKGKRRAFLLKLKYIHPKELAIFLSIPEFLFKLQKGVQRQSHLVEKQHYQSSTNYHSSKRCTPMHSRTSVKL